jgi:hypothetical protein
MSDGDRQIYAQYALLIVALIVYYVLQYNKVLNIVYNDNKCEEAMREVLGAGRGVQAGEVETPAMAAEAGRETRRGAESDEESDGCNEGTRQRARMGTQHIL